MAWKTVATTNLGDSSGTYGYVYLQYDDSSTGTSRSSRLRFEIKSGASIYIYIDNLALDGSSVKGRFLCSGTMNFWTGNLSAGTHKFTWSCPWYSGTRSYTCSGNIPSGVVAPSGLAVSVVSKTYNSATFKTSVSSYGTPASTSGRYIEAALLQQNSYSASTSNGRRWSIASNTTSANITVNNSSSKNGGASGDGFIITGNTKYYYGGYANNTQASTSKVVGEIYLPCPPLPSLSLKSQAYSAQNKVNATISYTRQADGGAETRTGYYRYSADGGMNYSGWISFGTISVDAGTAATFTASLPTASNITLQAKINTPNGGDSEIKSASFTTLATHTAPTFSDFEYEDSNNETVALTGDNRTVVQGQSIPKITISAENRAVGNDGINVSNYAITFTGQSKVASYSSDEDVVVTLDAPNDSGSCNLTVSAVDTIATSTAVAKSVTVYPWTAPTISATIERVNNFESESKINASGTFSPITVNGVVKNTLTLEYRSKKSSDSNWGEWIQRPVTVSGSNWSISSLSVSFDNNYQWDIQIRIVDAFTDAEVSLSLPVGIPNFFIGTDGRVSVGMKPSKTKSSEYRGQLEVDGLIYSNGELLVPSYVGQIIRSANLTTAAQVRAKYGGTWTRVTDYQLVAYAALTAETTIAAKKNITSVTKSGTGTYQVNLAKAMANANYIAFVSGEVGGAGQEIVGVYNRNTTYFNYDFCNNAGTMVTPTQVNIAVFGTLASPEEYVWKRTA